MSDNKGAPPPDGEHIEELLSQLKGIFGHLSETEREEARQKITPPAASLPRVPTPTPPPEPAAAPPEPPPAVAPEPLPLETPSEPAMDVSDLPPLEPWIPSEAPTAATPAAPPVAGVDDFAPSAVTIPEGASLIPTAIFYPAGRINDAKIVAEKVERIAPKFTKVAIVVNVQALAAYDAKTELKTTVMAQVNTIPIKAVFILVDKLLDDAKRKALVADLEPRGIYLQEIPSHQVEKKALYTDMLLGMVFFFDSQKQTPGEPTS